MKQGRLGSNNNNNLEQSQESCFEHIIEKHIDIYEEILVGSWLHGSRTYTRSLGCSANLGVISL